MEKIHYTKEKYIKEECEFEIDNPKECFLKGSDKNYNKTVYFGMWANSKGGKTIVLEDRQIIFDFSRYGLSGTTVPIKKFLQNNNNVEKINREIFFSNLEKIKELISE